MFQPSGLNCKVLKRGIGRTAYDYQMSHFMPSATTLEVSATQRAQVPK